MARRLLFDISTSMRWSGPPVGIVRVERELAKWAMRNDPDCCFVFFDGNLQTYREVRRNYLSAILEGAVTVDTTGMRDPSRSRPRRTERVPRFLLGPFLWLTQFRRMLLRTLGGLSLQSRSSKVQDAVGLLQNIVVGKKYRQMFIARDGARRALVPLDVLAGGSLRFQPGDRILFAGINWTHSNVGYLAEQKKHVAIDLVTLCFDVIPLISPQFFKPHDVEILRRHFDIAFAISSLVLVTSKVVAKDVRQYCAQQGISVGPVRQIPLGFDLPRHGGSSAIPAQARRYSRYIMFVSTIEPRKGHGLALAVWSRLLREGIPQRIDAALLIVGRPGWMVDDLPEKLSATDRIAVMSNVDDGELAALYDNADFCIYPSEYEGYGLPIVEALAYAKPVLASAIGVVPELEYSLLKSLPPNDEQAWYEAIKEWLENLPQLDGAPRFRHPTWQEAAAQTFKTIHDVH